MNGYDIPPNFKKRSTLRTIIAAGLVVATVACLAACAAPVSLYQTAPSKVLRWPAAPEAPKIVWVKSIANIHEAGITKSFWRRALELLIGGEQNRIARPHGVLFDREERLFIADAGAGIVHLMDLKQGQYIVIGNDNGSPLRTPIGLAEDEQGRLYIADSGAQMVFVYDIARGTLKPFLRQGLQRPTGIAFNRQRNRLYIVDTMANQVVVVDEDGRERQRISPGTGEEAFNHPTDIALDIRGQLYVTDPLNYRITVFSPDGQLVSQFGAAGDKPGYLNKPKGIALDSEGHIYVSDALLDAIQIFDHAGQLLMYFGIQGKQAGEFWMPSGLFIDKNDYIFVSDTYNNRVQIFRYVHSGLTDESDDNAVSGAGDARQPVK